LLYIYIVHNLDICSSINCL